MTRLLTPFLLSVLLSPAMSARADEAAPPHDHAHMHDMHARVQVSDASYATPKVSLVRADGKGVMLPAELDDGRPVVLDFIYTTCTTICPMMTATLAGLQRKLGREAAQVHLMSISIDPEQDTPARLREYAHRFGARPNWHFYTGTLAASIEAQKAFNVYRGDKMSHTSVMLMRARPGQDWRRVDGFATPEELLRNFRQLVPLERTAARAVFRGPT